MVRRCSGAISGKRWHTLGSELGDEAIAGWPVAIAGRRIEMSDLAEVDQLAAPGASVAIRS
jgi:hypothetical protein